MTQAGSRFAGHRELIVDAALAMLLAAVSITGTVGEILEATTPNPPAIGAYLLALASSAVLAWRRTYVVASAIASFVIAAAYPLLGYPGWAPIVAVFVALFSLAAYGRSHRALAGALVLCVLTLLIPALAPDAESMASPVIWAPAFTLAWVSLLGASMRRRRIDAEDRLRQAAAAADARAHQRIADDRLQVARELHDVLAHTISVIAVQSGLAADALDDDTETVRSALGKIRVSTRQALGELRATLTLLRAEPTSDDDADHPSQPQPQLAQIPELADRARTTGLTVTLAVATGDRMLSPALELTAYRVVQEAITNVIRHADAHAVDVSVHRNDTYLHVTIVDDGCGPDGNEAGFGIRGMRERVEALGGTIFAGPGPGGGYEVRADLPIERWP